MKEIKSIIETIIGILALVGYWSGLSVVFPNLKGRAFDASSWDFFDYILIILIFISYILIAAGAYSFIIGLKKFKSKNYKLKDTLEDEKPIIVIYSISAFIILIFIFWMAQFA